MIRINPMMIATMLLALCLFSLGFWFGRRTKSLKSKVLVYLLGLVFAFPGLLYAFYCTHLFEPTPWFIALRIAPYSELLAAGMGFLAGVVQALLKPEKRAAKLALPAILLAAISVPFLKSFLDPVDLRQLKASCKGESCLQSTPSTCGPSSAASLLINYGFPASELELARDSFTSNSGTEIWNLARALQKRGFLTRIEIQKSDAISPPGSSIAGVLLPGRTGHFVAILESRGDNFLVMDPLKGLLATSRWGLGQSYKFTGFFLLVQPADPTRTAAISPQQVVEQFLAREMAGERFGPEGWRHVSASLIHATPPPAYPDVIIMNKDYSVWPPFFRDGRAEVMVGMYHAGDIDSSLRYKPPDPSEYKSGVIFLLDFIQSESPRAAALKRAGITPNPPEWKIEDTRFLTLDVPATIRYLQEKSAQTNDPVLKKNGSQALSILRATHE